MKHMLSKQSTQTIEALEEEHDTHFEFDADQSSVSLKGMGCTSCVSFDLPTSQRQIKANVSLLIECYRRIN